MASDDLAPIVPDGNSPVMIRRAFERLNERISRLRALFEGTVTYALQVETLLADLVQADSVEAGSGLEVGSLSGLLKASSGTVTVGVAGTDYQSPITWGTGLAFSAGTASVDITEFTAGSPTGASVLVFHNGTTHLKAAITSVWLAGFTQQSNVADASTSHAITDPLDSPADADALREDLVNNVIPSIETALNNLGTTINAVISRLETLGLFAP